MWHIPAENTYPALQTQASKKRHFNSPHKLNKKKGNNKNKESQSNKISFPVFPPCFLRHSVYVPIPKALLLCHPMAGSGPDSQHWD